jgi:hypothetical protein
MQRVRQNVRNAGYGCFIIWTKFIDPGSDTQKVQIPIFGSSESDLIVSYWRNSWRKPVHSCWTCNFLIKFFFCLLSHFFQLVCTTLLVQIVLIHRRKPIDCSWKLASVNLLLVLFSPDQDVCRSDAWKKSGDIPVTDWLYKDIYFKIIWCNTHYDRSNQLQNSEYLHYMCSLITNDARFIHEMKSKSAMAKAAFNNERTFSPANLT